MREGGGGGGGEGPQGTKKRLRARGSAARNFCPTRGSSDDLVGQLRKDWRELPLLELQIEDSIRRLDAF